MGQHARRVWAVSWALMLAVGCASTKMTDTWTDPSARGAGLAKVAVVYLGRDEGVRRLAEDDMAQQMPTGLASYRVLKDTDLASRAAVQEKLRAEGFDGVLVMRLAGIHERTMPRGDSAGSFAKGYDAAYDAVSTPGAGTETVVRVVGDLYSLKEDKLIWSGASQTFDPASATTVVSGVSKAVARALQKDQLIL